MTVFYSFPALDLDQSVLVRLQCAVVHGSSVAASNVAVGRHVAVEPGQDLSGTGAGTPVAHQIADDGEQRHELHAGLLHAGVGSVADKSGGGAGSLDVGEDRITFLAEGEGQERSADVGGDAGDDDLLLTGGADGGAELFVVPGAGDGSVIVLGK